MNFDPILYGPLFVRDASDVNLVASGADPVEVTVASGGSSWPLPVTPVLAGGQYIAPLRMREILSSVVDIPGLAAAGVREVPLVTLSAGGASMSFRVVYGSAAGRTPAQLAGHWLTWRDQISKTQTWGRERLTFLAGLDLLGWQSGSYSVSAKVFFASGDPETVTLASGTLQSGCRYVTVDASYAVIAAAVQSAGNITAWDVSYAFSGVTTGGSAASVDGYPLRLVVARPDVRVKEFIFCNSFGVEDRVYSSGRSNPKVEGTSVAFLSGGTESELRNDAEEGKEVYSGHISSARDGALWTDFLKARDRHILLSGALEQIVVDSHETDFQDNAIGSVKFTYHLSKLDAGRFFQDAEGLGDYDPGQQYGALYVGDDPAAEELPAEDLFFLKTRLDEFPAADLTEELLFLVQNPLTQAWGNAPLSALKNWLQEAVSARQTPVWSGPWADYSAGVADYALAASLGRDLYDRIQNIEQNPYNLPVASDTVLGGIRVGANLSIDAAGVLSASAVQPGDLKSLTLKVDTATVGSYTPTEAKTLTITAQHLYDAIGREKYHPFGGEHDDNTEKTFYIGGALFTWHPASDNTPGYLELNSAFLTGGDQIVNNGTPGQGGGSGGAGYLYELGDIFHKYTNAQSQEVDANAVLRPQSYWTNPTTPVVAQNNDLLIKTSSGWAAIPQSSITTDLTNYYTKSETDSEISSAISALNLGAAATYGIGSVASGNTGLVMGGAVYSYVNDVVSSALKFQGTTTTAISDGSTTNPITINSQSYTAKKGDVVLYDGKEYLWTGSAWEQLGDEASWALKTTTISAGTGLTGGGTLAANRTISLSQATIDSLALADSAYQKPSGGIPKTDLASAVQTSLGLADTAYQKPSGGIPNSDIATPWVKVGTTQINLGGQQTSLAGLVNVTMTGKLTIGSAEITWVEGVGGADGYLKISTALVTEGDQIVNSGTPGGGGTGGAGNLYELNDIYASGNYVRRADDTNRSDGDLLAFNLSKGKWVALDPSTIAGTTYREGTGITISNANVISVTANTYAPYNSAGYLPLSAGSTKALTDALYVSAGNVYNLYLNNSASGATNAGIRFQVGGTTIGELYTRTSDNQLIWNGGSNGAKVIYHTGNLTLSNGVITIGSNTITPVTDVTYDSTSDRIQVTKGGSASNVLVGFATTSKRFARYQGENVAGGYDLDTLLSGGGITSQYGSSTYWANKPTGMTYGGVVQLNTQASDSLCMQFAWDVVHTSSTVGDTGKLWWRDKPTAGWGTWHLIYDSASLTKSVVTGLLGNEYHPYGGATGIPFLASTIGANGNITITGSDRSIYMGEAGSVKQVMRLVTSSYLLIGSGTYDTLPTIIYGTPIRFYTNNNGTGAEMMRLLANGTLLIGATSLPSGTTAKLYVNGTVGVSGTITATGNVVISNSTAVERKYQVTNSLGTMSFGQTAAGNGYVHNSGAYNIGFYTNATERLRIDGAGDTTVMNKLYIGGTSGACLEWDSTNGVLKINKALLTEGDQIVNSGTPGGGGGGTIPYLYELQDVTITNIGTGNLLQWNGSAWVNVAASSVGVTTVATTQALGLVKSTTTGTTANRTYNVEVNTDGTMKVNVPWENNTYSLLTSSANGLAPAFSTANKATSASTNSYYFLGWTGSTMKWYSLPANAFSDTTYSAATQSAAGLMSSTDKTKLDGIATGATAVTDTTVSGWGYLKTDEKVKQTATTTSAAYEILFSYSANNTTTTEGARKTSTLTYNPSTKALSTGGAVNGLTLTAATTGFTIAGGSTTSKTLTVNETGTAVLLTATQALTNKTYNGYTLGDACAKGYTDSSSASAISTGTSLVTERDVYYGLPTINNSHAYTSSTTIYAPTGAGTSGYWLKASGGTSAPTWEATSNLEAGKVTTTADTTNALYVVGVTSGATSTLKRDTSVTITGGAVSATSLTLAGALSGATTGSFSSDVTISGVLNLGTSSSAALNFQRTSANYITAPASGYFCFVPNGGATSIATSSLVVNDTSVYSGKSTTTLGSTTYPWQYGYFANAIYLTRAGVYNSIVTSGRNSGLRVYTTADADDASAAVAFQIDGNKNARFYGSLVRDGYDIHSRADARIYVWNAATSSASLALRAYSGNYLQLGPGTYTTVPTMIYGQYLRFFTYNSNSTASEVIRILRDGNVGIGTTSPTERLHVAGTILSTGDQVVSSDATLKKDWRPLNYGIADIAKATAGVFTWKDGRGISAGTKAQDWEKLVPQLVHGEEGHKTLAYGQIAMLNTILLARHETEQDKEIKSLRERVAELEKEVKRLRMN